MQHAILQKMNKKAALELLADEDYEPASYAEAAEIFSALYERAPDAVDGDRGQIWSLCCAYSAGSSR